jgi:hypothetical protein
MDRLRLPAANFLERLLSFSVQQDREFVCKPLKKLGFPLIHMAERAWLHRQCFQLTSCKTIAFLIVSNVGPTLALTRRLLTG